MAEALGSTVASRAGIFSDPSPNEDLQPARKTGYHHPSPRNGDGIYSCPPPTIGVAFSTSFFPTLKLYPAHSDPVSRASLL